MKKLLIVIAALLLGAGPSYAQKTKAQIDAEIVTLFPDNTAGQITPLGLRTVAADTVNSIMPTAPVVAGNLACFNGTTGLLQDCGVSPISFPLANLAPQNALTLVANNTGGTASPTAVTYSAFADNLFGSSTQGTVATRIASQWAAIGPGLAGQPFIGGGAGTNVSFGSTVASYTNFTNTGTGASAVTLQSDMQQRKNVFQYGAVCDGSTDDTTAFQNTINAALAPGLGNVSSGTAFAPPGYICKINGNLTANKPVSIDFGAEILDGGTTGALLTVNSVSPSGNTQGFNIHLANCTQSGGNSTTPTSINASGRFCLKINSMNFSSVRIDACNSYTFGCIFLNGLGDVFSPQVIQHNTITLGQLIFNGVGIKLLSLNAATSSAEGNRFDVQNVYGSCVDVLLDDGTHNASTSNTFNIQSMDNSSASAGCAGIDNFSLFNVFNVGYTAAPIKMESSSGNNTVYVGNTIATGVSFSDAGTANHLFSAGADWVTQVGSYLNTFSTVVSFTNTTNSTTSSTGATVISGGLGIAKDTHSNGDIYLDNAASGTIFMGGVSSLSRSQATGKLSLATNASDIDLQPSSGSVTNSGGFLSRNAAVGVGYVTGAGGTVTQATSRTTGVTLNKISGAITLFSAAGSATANTFTVTNSSVAATDVVVLSQKSGTDKYETFVTAVAAGSFNITFFTTGGTTTEQPVFNFSVIKGASN